MVCRGAGLLQMRHSPKNLFERMETADADMR
jgi:hypothetical protein